MTDLESLVLSSLKDSGFFFLKIGILSNGELKDFAQQFGTISKSVDCKPKGCGESVDEVIVRPGVRSAGVAYGNTTPHHEDSCSRCPPDLIIINCMEARGAILRLVDLTVDHAIATSFRSVVLRHSTKYYRSYIGPNVSSYHPAVLKTLDSDRKALFVNPLFTDELVTKQNSQVTNLFSRLFRAAKKISHIWESGDLAVFDNKRFVHFGNALPQYGFKRLSKAHVHCRVI